jgi:hypothetical protein
MIRIAIILSMFVAGLLIPDLSQPSDSTLETSHLIVSDTIGKLSNEQLKRLADHAQETLNRVLAFWSADPGIARFGKIRVVFDVPRSGERCQALKIDSCHQGFVVCFMEGRESKIGTATI